MFRKLIQNVSGQGNIPLSFLVNGFLRLLSEKNDNFAQIRDETLLQKTKMQQRAVNAMRKKKEYKVK